MALKKCNKCLIEKETIEFHAKSMVSDGLSSICKPCKKITQSHYYQATKELYSTKKDAINARRRERRLKNIDEIRKKEKELRSIKRDNIALNAKKWRDNNKEHFAQWRKNNYQLNKEIIHSQRRQRKSIDPLFKMSNNLRTRIWHAIKVKKWIKDSKFSSYIGCSMEEFRLYLQSKFELGMTWDNYGINGWHIDHIVPLSLAKNQQELMALCHYSNLQPLWAKDNIRKGNKSGT